METRTYTNTSSIEQVYYDKMGVARVLKPGQSFQEEIIPGERNLILGGKELDFAGAVVNVLARDRDGNVLFAHGTAVPSEKAGFAKGCLFIKTDAPDGSKSVYENTGLTSAAVFDVIGDISGAEIADGAITNVKVANDAAIAGTKISPDFGSQNIVTKGHAAVGNNSDFSPMLALNVDEVSSQQYIYGLYANIQPTYSGDSSVAVGVMGQVNRDSAADFGTIYGGYFNASAINNSSPQKTIGTLKALFVSAVSSGDYTTVDHFYGLSSEVSTAYNMVSEAIGEMVGGSFRIFLGSGQIDVTLAKTLSVDVQKGGTLTGSLGTLYGVYIGDHSALGFSTNYNLYSAGAASKNMFEGSLEVRSNLIARGQSEIYGEPVDASEIYALTIRSMSESASATTDRTGIRMWVGDTDSGGRLNAASGMKMWIGGGDIANVHQDQCWMLTQYDATEMRWKSCWALVQGNLTTYYGVSEYLSTMGSGKTLATAYLAYLGETQVSDSSITNLYGVYIEPQTVGTSASYNMYSAGAASKNRFEGNLELGNAAITIAALADTIRLYGKDYAAGDARLYIQAEGGNPIVIGNNEIQISSLKVLGARVVDARADDVVDATWDSTDAGVLQAVRDAMIAHGLLAAA